MEQNGTFLENFEYDHQILHKKSGWDEIYTIFHEIAHISLNIGRRISNPKPWSILSPWLFIMYLYSI